MFLLLLAAVLAAARAANFTLDDAHTRLTYHPSHAWLPATRPCPALACSWHQSDPARTAHLEFSFVGSAIFLFALPFPVPANLSFVLDGAPLPPYAHTPADPNFLALRNLPNTRHTLQLTVHPGSTFFFDYLVYAAEPDPSPVLRMQPRQVTDSPPTLTPTANPMPNNSQQIGAIAGAIAASIGITSLFSIGLAVSIIKIRRQRLRNRREREAELERTRGLSLHLPSASVSAAARIAPVPRYPTGQGPPPYESVMRLMSPAPAVSATFGRLPAIEEAATIRSSQTSRLTPPEGSLSDAPDNPPGLALATVSDHPSEETIRVSQEEARQ